MKTFYLIISVLCFSVLAISCEKEVSSTSNHTHSNTDKNIFDHGLPIRLDSIAYLDTVFFSTRVQAETELHGYEVTLQNLTTNLETIITSAHTHANAFTISGFWVNKVAVNSNMRANFVVAVNHEGDTASYAIDFICLTQ